MQGPVRHMPLCLCDPESVNPSDIQPASNLNIPPLGRDSNTLSLKYSPNHKWFYYPEMRADEMIAFT